MIVSEPIRQELITMLLRLVRAKTTPRHTRLSIAFFLLNRTDPVPQAPPVLMQATGPVTFHWGETSSPSHRLQLNAPSSNGSDDSASSSAIEDSANRFWQ